MKNKYVVSFKKTSWVYSVAPADTWWERLLGRKRIKKKIESERCSAKIEIEESVVTDPNFHSFVKDLLNSFGESIDEIQIELGEFPTSYIPPGQTRKESRAFFDGSEHVVHFENCRIIKEPGGSDALLIEPQRTNLFPNKSK